MMESTSMSQPGDDASEIIHYPAPWRCRATMYIMPIYFPSSPEALRSKCYASLEAPSSSDVQAQLGKHKGGLGFVQIVRYSETPAGTYDELVIAPGYFKTPKGLGVKGSHLRITGMWVSQKTTLMNGRKNWNIPKHLARFEWTKLDQTAKSPLKVEVFDPEAKAPFFTTTIHPTSWTPTFPFSSSWQDKIGLCTSILQPPLPNGPLAGIEVGSSVWMKANPVVRSSKSRVVRLDMQQRYSTGSEAKESPASERPDYQHGSTLATAPNWWPGLGRRRIGIVCEDAILELDVPIVYQGPQGD